MTTVINNPGGGDSSDSGMGMILGVIVVLVIVVLFFIYGLPAIRNNAAPQNGNIDVNVKLPTGGGGILTLPLPNKNHPN